MPAFPVLFVCVGNLCRSPFGERLLRRRLDQAGVAQSFAVTSAGTGAVVGGSMHPRSEAGLVALGGSAEGFAARQLEGSMVETSGLVLTATRALRVRVLEDSPAAVRRTFTVLELGALAESAPSGLGPAELILDCADRRSTVAGRDADLPDPIRAAPEVFDRVAASLDTAVTAIAWMLAAANLTQEIR